MKRFSFLLTLMATGGMLHAQQLSTTIPSTEGRVFVIPPGPGYVIDDIHLDSVSITISGIGGALAHVIIQDGTEATLIYADTIYVEPTMDNFTLTGNARIEQGTNILYGPKKIQFTSRNNIMILEGNPEQPAKYEYTLANGMQAFSTGEVFHLHFLELDGKRRLKSVETVKGHRGSRIFPQAKVIEKTLQRKMSGP